MTTFILYAQMHRTSVNEKQKTKNLKETKADMWGCLEKRKEKEKEQNYNIKKKNVSLALDIPSIYYSGNCLSWSLFSQV